VAERAAGAAAGADGFALLWMSDGLGVAIDLGGVVHRSASGGAGEIGYLPPPASAAEFDPAAEDLTDLVGRGAFERLGGIQALDVYAERVALVAAPVLAVLDPELVVLGGPIGIAGGERLAELVAAHLAATSRWTPEVRPTGITSQPVIGGARRVLVHRIREHLAHGISSLSTP
jgi:predicted NBD/HSP70 family sugar kinase